MCWCAVATTLYTDYSILGAPLETCSSWTLALAGPGAVTNTPRPDLSDHRATDQDQDTEYWTLYTAALCAPDTLQIYYLCKHSVLQLIQTVKAKTIFHGLIFTLLGFFFLYKSSISSSDNPLVSGMMKKQMMRFVRQQEE